MKIAFLSESPEMLLKVYEAETVSALSQTDKIYRKSDVIANRENFGGCFILVYAFSCCFFSLCRSLALTAPSGLISPALLNAILVKNGPISS